jgi:DNA-binding PadR family transcriptional regulator
MKNIISNINKEFESRVRLGIMSILCVNDWVDFLTLKTHLNVTDGNLASHISALEKKQYIEIKKEFVGKKTKTSYRVTHNGRKAFGDHLNGLEVLLKSRE